MTPYVQQMREAHVRTMETKGRKTLDKFLELEPVKKGTRVKSVKWAEIVSAHHEFLSEASDGVDDDTHSDLLRYLDAKNILCTDDRGFFPFADGIDVGPSVGGLKYHFARKEDAVAYTQAQFASTLYPVRVAEVVTGRLNE